MSEAEAGLETLARAARQRMAQLTQIAAAPQAAAEHDRDGLMAVFRDVLLQQGAAADLLRMLTLQERALAAVLSAADQRTVWATLPHVRQAWDALAAATGAEDEDGEEESGGEAAAFGSADGAEPEHAAVPQQTHAQGAGVADGAPKQGVVLFRWSTNYKLQTCLLLPPPPPTPEGLTGSDAQRDAPPQPPSAHNQQASPVGATSSGGAGLPPSPRGEEREVPYHEGLERQLPERFKVKFLAWSTATDLPPAPPLPPASFLFLQRGRDDTLKLLGVVERATLTRSSNPNVRPHVYILQVRRAHAEPERRVLGGEGRGSLSGSGAGLKQALCTYFGVSEEDAQRVHVKRGAGSSSSPHIKDVLWLPGSTPRLPCPLT